MIGTSKISKKILKDRRFYGLGGDEGRPLEGAFYMIIIS